MALTNAEKQKNWRERHIRKRRTVQRITSLLLRQTWSDEHLETLGGLLQQIMNREAAKALRRALKPRTNEEMDAYHRENERGIQAWWLAEHPGRTRTEYNRALRDADSKVWEWRRAKGQAANEAERQAWERDHPGQQFPEHECGLSDREYADLERWRRQRERRRRQNH